MKRAVVLIALSACCAGMLAACSAPSVRCTSPVDNPAYHYLRGMEALEARWIGVAEDHFDRAAYCNNEFSPGYSGLALVMAEKGREERDSGHRAVDVQRMRDNLRLAEKHAEEPADEFYYHLARMRTGILLKEHGWLTEAEDSFGRARELKVDDRQLLYYQGREAADYFMGLAYLEARDLPKARDRFAGVLGSRREGKWNGKAEAAWKKTDKIVRAMAGLTVGNVGEKVALQDSVSRADLAALLMNELQLEKLFAGRIPDASRLAAMKAEFVPADVVSHPFRDDILRVMKWKVRGLEPKYDERTRAYLFSPAESVSRGEMALILEDVLIKLTRDEKLATAYLGQERSPFPDVRPTSPFYNAVLNMTTRGIMEGELSGGFRINAVVDGAEAILALRVLKQKMNIY